MSDFTAANYTLGQFNAAVKLLQKQSGHEDAFERFLRGELTVSEPVRRWREENGVIYFSVTSDGTTGEEWIARLIGRGFRVGDYAKSVLRSADFKPTSRVTTEVAVLKGSLFTDSERITKKVRKEAERRKFGKPNAEVACLIREMFTDKELEAMGLVWIVVMHEPINDSDGDPTLLYAVRRGDGSWLDTYWVNPDNKWFLGNGFAFSLSQV